VADDPAIERDKLQLEMERFEHQKELDKNKSGEERFRTIATSLSIFIPLIVAAITFASSSYSQARQAEDQLELRQIQDQAQFELQAAEIVMASDNPAVTYNKALALEILFPNRIPSDFADEFDPGKFSSSSPAGIVQSKKELLTLLAEHPEERRQILDTWKQLFPEDEWVKELE
jgi:hypothetical protein